MCSRLYFVFLVNLFVCSFAQRQLYEGDDCDLTYNEKGICVRVSLCPSAIEIVQQKLHPKKCGFVRSIPIVCCSKTQAKITRLAEQMCIIFQIPIVGVTPPNPPPNNRPFLPSLQPNERPAIGTYQSGQNFEDYPNSRKSDAATSGNGPLFRNGHQTPPLQHTPSLSISKRQVKPEFHKFVIGGVDAQKREFPHMAALGYINGNQKLWLCGGSLISDQFVLTAAHCLSSKDFGPLEWVRLGELNLTSTIDQEISEDYRPIRKIPHPLYVVPSVYHDIALVQLDRNIEITSYIKPACLYTQAYVPFDEELLATGWGLTNVGGKQSDILQKVDLNVFTEKECDETYKNIATTRRLKNGILHRQQICVGARSEEKDTCQGDSGGPLQIQINDEDGERFYIVGVTSFGRSCGIPNVPGIYTRVSYYLPWIEGIVWPEENY